jgi:hypothetical protein
MNCTYKVTATFTGSTPSILLEISAGLFTEGGETHDYTYTNATGIPNNGLHPQVLFPPLPNIIPPDPVPFKKPGTIDGDPHFDPKGPSWINPPHGERGKAEYDGHVFYFRFFLVSKLPDPKSPCKPGCSMITMDKPKVKLLSGGVKCRAVLFGLQFSGYGPLLSSATGSLGPGIAAPECDSKNAKSCDCPGPPIDSTIVGFETERSYKDCKFQINVDMIHIKTFQQKIVP